MSLIAPLSLLLGLLAVPIVLLYMLRLRRKDVPVSSTMLWLRLLRDREANTPWQRLRRNLLLLIQLAVLALLVFALARPYLPVPSVTAGSVVVLLDGSASMLAREGESQRFDLARGEVERIINELPGDSQMTLILVGSTPRVLVSASQDRSEMREALAQAQAAPVSGDWPAALALAPGAAQGFEDGRVVLVSDGGLPEDLPPVTVDVVYVPVGTAAENLAISALSAREGPNGPDLFASVTNHGALPQQGLFNLSLDGELFDARRINVPAGDTVSLSWTLPEQVSVIQAGLSDNGQDQLPLDDQAWTVYQGRGQSKVLLLTNGNRFLETALSIMPGLDVFKADTGFGLAAVDEGEFDLLVVDSGPAPQDLPGVDMLIIDPQNPAAEDGDDSAATLSTGGVFTNTEIVRLEDSPLLQFVDWSGVNVRAATEVDAPWARPLVVAEGGPLLLAGEMDGSRAVILTFRLQDSDLPLQIAFPIVMANIMDWFDPGGALLSQTAYAPGEPVRLGVDPGAEAIVIHKPDGALWVQEADESALIFPETDQRGVYEVMSRNSDGERLVGRFAVNMIDGAESTIAPAASVRLGLGTEDVTARDDVGQRELWPWLASVALLVLLVEWWIYHRGARLPNRDDWHSLTGRHEI